MYSVDKPVDHTSVDDKLVVSVVNVVVSSEIVVLHSVEDSVEISSVEDSVENSSVDVSIVDVSIVVDIVVVSG